MAAIAGSRVAAVLSVPDFQLPSGFLLAPMLRGKNSYQLPTPARSRSTWMPCCSLTVARLDSGRVVRPALSLVSCAAARRAAGLRSGSASAATASPHGLAVAGPPEQLEPLGEDELDILADRDLDVGVVQQLAQSSLYACTRKCQLPTRSSSASACQRSVPGATRAHPVLGLRAPRDRRAAGRRRAPRGPRGTPSRRRDDFAGVGLRGPAVLGLDGREIADRDAADCVVRSRRRPGLGSGARGCGRAGSGVCSHD